MDDGRKHTVVLRKTSLLVLSSLNWRRKRANGFTLTHSGSQFYIEYLRKSQQGDNFQSLQEGWEEKWDTKLCLKERDGGVSGVGLFCVSSVRGLVLLTWRTQSPFWWDENFFFFHFSFFSLTSVILNFNNMPLMDHHIDFWRLPVQTSLILISTRIFFSK